ncbi:hypothetical protein MPL1_09497 [Methylophaga lonarensis MPL]|uniref:Uncharacterized protein n=1 Tax=Methylophaga lonarensis MPL TaxID=1286106 RepID=M7NZC8_9GAMM|nr:hypothetical protein [Methylophaga lonarensis]EMR12576.1 hypothetical protein MPL1_09497 [Methylophaga lonarensis MPL]
MGLLIYPYLILAFYLTKKSFKWARSDGKPGWHYGLPVGVLLFAVVMWDWIPTYLSHRSLCMQHGGITIHKTIDQWQAENPGIAETLIADSEAKDFREDGVRKRNLNQRFVFEFQFTRHFMGIRGESWRVRDRETGDLIVSYANYEHGLMNNFAGESTGDRNYKFWLMFGTGSCGMERTAQKNQFFEYRTQLMNLGS